MLAYQRPLHVYGLCSRREAKKFIYGHVHGHGYEYEFGYYGAYVGLWDSGRGSTQFTAMYGDNDDDDYGGGPGMPCVIFLTFGSVAIRAAYNKSNGCLENVRTVFQRAVHDYISTDINICVEIDKDINPPIPKDSESDNDKATNGKNNNTA